MGLWDHYLHYYSHKRGIEGYGRDSIAEETSQGAGEYLMLTDSMNHTWLSEYFKGISFFLGFFRKGFISQVVVPIVGDYYFQCVPCINPLLQHWSFGKSNYFCCLTHTQLERTSFKLRITSKTSSACFGLLDILEQTNSRSQREMIKEGIYIKSKYLSTCWNAQSDRMNI